MAGTHVCLRRVEAAAIYEAIAREGVTHLCGAPVVMNMLLNAGAGLKRSLDRRIEMMSAGARTWRRHTWVPATTEIDHGKHQPLQWNIGSVHR